MSEPRVVVIGAGIVGLSTAFELLRLGAEQVTVLEARHPGEGSSGRSVGMVETQYLDAADIEVRAFGHARFGALSREHGLSFVRGGYLRMAHDQADLDRFAESVARQAQFEIHDATVLLPRDIEARWPQLDVTDRAGALFGPSDGYVDGYECCTLLARLVREAGGDIVLNAELTAVESAPQGRVLVTEKGRFPADVVVNAAGGWAGRVGDLLDAPIPLAPQLHGAVAIELDGPMTPLLPFVMDYVPGSGTDGVYFRSERPDQLIAGLHTDEAIHRAVSPDVALGPVSHDFVERVSALMAQRMTDCDGFAVGRSWTGIYPMTPDHRPIVGTHPEAADVVCAAGAGGSGIQLSPAMARMAAEEIVNGKVTTFSSDTGWATARVCPSADRFERSH
ncbi:NAD(P)/FAD-dependent oxidoreductase [Prauserella flavalba]|uniref:FAD dependent oxidoreductase domain-containing protein n=1 Tax=Prauserella flavalba TaxID=1477506 RepID=A0A318LBV7_9PSEU|nr:FAD-dependent oxidoreductase [Prauserella flavalba]PXY21534.1 hypothetical protein BA062_32000 [Prauserella flavalba]